MTKTLTRLRYQRIKQYSLFPKRGSHVNLSESTGRAAARKIMTASNLSSDFFFTGTHLQYPDEGFIIDINKKRPFKAELTKHKRIKFNHDILALGMNSPYQKLFSIQTKHKSERRL